jgi:hypothetical protein
VQVVFKPLQELSASTDARATNREHFFEFIHVPRERIRQTAPDGPGD